MNLERTPNIYFLREDVYVDPMINTWYAWPNLLSPATYAMYLTKTHKRLMKSFVKDHQLHILANQDPELAGGGEFVDCSENQVADVRQLLDRWFSCMRSVGSLGTALIGLSYTENSEQMLQSSRLVEHCERIGIPIKRLNGKHELTL